MFTESSFPEAPAFWFVVISFNGVVSNLSCVAAADDAALNPKWEPLLDTCGIWRLKKGCILLVFSCSVLSP